MKPAQRELALTAVGMVAAAVRKDDEGVKALREGYGDGPMAQELLTLQLVEIARGAVELYAKCEDRDPEEALQLMALKLARA